MTRSGIGQMVRLRGKEAGLTLQLHPHMFRHLFAHTWLSQGGNESDLMRLTGWKSRQMLMRYAASTGTERALAAAKRLDLFGRL
jgi:integrase